MKPHIIQGDFMINSQYLIPGSVDLILTDPPYGILHDVLKWDETPDLRKMEAAFSTLLKPNGLAILFCNLGLMTKLLSTFGSSLKYRGYHVWRKGAAMPINQYTPLPDAEMILVFRQANSKVSACTFNGKAGGGVGEPYTKLSNQLCSPNRRQVKSNLYENMTGLRWIRTVLDAPGKCNMAASERTKHPTQKPIELLKRLILTYSNADDLILDPFAGSGSTLIAAYHSLRHSIGMEINAEYFEMARLRIANHCQQGLLPF